MTEKEKLEKIKERIRRLLALSQSPNVHEAAAALAKAQELMFKYNLEHQEIPTEQRAEYEGIKFVVGQGREVAWARELIHTLAQYNFCKSIYHHDVDSRGRLHRVDWMWLIGEPHNIEIVSYFHEYCREEIKRLAEIEWNNVGYGSKVSWKKDFCYGAVRGVGEKLYQQWLHDRNASGATQALVLVKDKDLQNAVGKYIGRIKPMRAFSDGMRYNSNTYNLGKEKGKEIEFRGGVKGGGHDPHLLE